MKRTDAKHNCIQANEWFDRKERVRKNAGVRDALLIYAVKMPPPL